MTPAAHLCPLRRSQQLDALAGPFDHSKYCYGRCAVQFQAVPHEASDGCRLRTIRRDSPGPSSWLPWAGILPGLLQGRYCAAFVLLSCLPLVVPGAQKTCWPLQEGTLAPRCRGTRERSLRAHAESRHLPCLYDSLSAAAARQTASSSAPQPRWSPPRQGATLLAFTTGTLMQASGPTSPLCCRCLPPAAAGPPPVAAASQTQLANLVTSCFLPALQRRI